MENMQRGIKDLKVELASLKDEKANCFNEYQVSYDGEVEALRKRFWTEVEEAANEKAEILKGENNDLVSFSFATGKACLTLSSSLH